MNAPPEEWLVLSPDTLAFFVDDSGDQALGDPGNPLFALGGISVMGSDYIAVVDAWRRATIGLPRPKGRLHFSERRSLGLPKRLPIHQFLQTAGIGRFAAVATRNTRLAGMTVEDIVLDSLKNRFMDLLRWSPCEKAVFVFEQSARLETPVNRHFSNLKIEANGGVLPYDCCWMPKSACEPLLEIADWLIHTVAAQVRFGQRFPRSFTDDLCAAFHSVDARLASYIDVTTAFPNPQSSRTTW